jgi:TolB-like protein/class 3 adenylate cyclase
MDRKLTAILAADMVGYGRHIDEAEELALERLQEYRSTIDELVASHRGRTFGSAGDSVLAEFSSPVEAVRCALSIQQEIERRNADVPERQRMRFRIGIHLGDVVIDGETLQGEGVNIAVRLEGMAEPGGILISGDVHRQVYRTLKMEYEDLGERRLKNIADPMQVYRVLAAPLPWWRKQLQAPSLRRRAAIPLGLLLGFGLFALFSLTSDFLPSALREAVGLGGIRQASAASIAVLPLRNVSNDSNQEYFSDGLTQDITGELGQFKDLFVLASNSAFTYKGKSAKAQDIGRDLGVVYLLEGSVMKEDDRLRVTAQLIDTRTGQQVWSQRYDKQGKDIFAIQDNIISAVASSLAVQVKTAAGYTPSAADATRNAEAYDHFLRGRQLFLTYERESVAASKREFQAAIALDPNYARAYSYLGYAQIEEFTEGWSDNPQKTADEALQSATKAVELEPSDYYTRWTLAAVHATRGDQDKALAEYQKALELNPHDADMLAEMADVFSNQSEGAKAVEQIKQAMLLNPKFPDWYYWSLGFAYFQSREYAEAAAAIEKIVDKPNEAYLIWVASQNRLGKAVPHDTVMSTVKLKDPEWDPKTLATMIPFAKEADKAHWLESFKSSGFDPSAL